MAKKKKDNYSYVNYDNIELYFGVSMDSIWWCTRDFGSTKMVDTTVPKSWCPSRFSPLGATLLLNAPAKKNMPAVNRYLPFSVHFYNQHNNDFNKYTPNQKVCLDNIVIGWKDNVDLTATCNKR